jgi:hypothetical protein
MQRDAEFVRAGWTRFGKTGQQQKCCSAAKSACILWNRPYDSFHAALHHLF